MATIKGLLINPAAQTIEEVDVEEGDSSFLHSMYRLLDCDCVDVVRGYFSREPYKSEDDLWVDDEALLKEPPVQWGFTLHNNCNPILGKALVLGVDLTEGECKNFTLSPEAVEKVRKNIQWCYCIR